jgi:hypothetical protein
MLDTDGIKGEDAESVCAITSPRDTLPASVIVPVLPFLILRPRLRRPKDDSGNLSV